MVTLARVVQVLDLLPKKLSVSDITIDECWEIWRFLDSNNKASISQQMLKNKLANEYGVSVNRLDEVSENKPLCEVLTWCSEDSTVSNITLQESIEFMRNLHNDDNKILDFANRINSGEAEVIWRWALDYRWASVKNRMLKWLQTKSGLDGNFIINHYIKCIFLDYDANVFMKTMNITKVTPYNSSVIPVKWWFIPDLKKLIRVKDGVAKHRNNDFNTDIMPLLKGDEDCWIWRDNLDTMYFHNKEYDFSFSNYKEPLHIEWDKCQTLLESYSRGGFIVEDSAGNTYMKSNKTNRLIGQLMNIRNLNKGGYEFVIGFSDAGEVVDTTTIVMSDIPFSLESALKRRGVYPNIKHSSYNIEDCLVVELNYTWSTSKDWHLSFVTVLDDYGIEDVEDISYYFSVVGEDEHN